MADKLKNIKEKIRKELAKNPAYLDGCDVPALKAVLFETGSACNRKCAWCPNYTTDRGNHFLGDKVFYKVMAELKEMKFEGRVSFSMYNEPLLDKRLPKFIEHVRKNIPSAYIYLNTNGDALTSDVWKSLRGKGLDYANVSQYDGKINENIEKILNGLDSGERKHLGAHIFDLNTINNRAGLIKSRALEKPLQEKCSRPSYQLCINYKGEVVVCCNDYHGSVTVGDAGKESIKDLWSNYVFKFYRKKLSEGDRASLELCNLCDLCSSPVPPIYPKPSFAARARRALRQIINNYK
ncbi:MAG: radical SAM/SPASM domain-containing protein [Candidatus Diapherotrites archaeon]